MTQSLAYRCRLSDGLIVSSQIRGTIKIGMQNMRQQTTRLSEEGCSVRVRTLEEPQVCLSPRSFIDREVYTTGACGYLPRWSFVEERSKPYVQDLWLYLYLNLFVCCQASFVLNLGVEERKERWNGIQGGR